MRRLHFLNPAKRTLPMNPCDQLLKYATELARCCGARNYPGASLWLARLLPPVSILWATDPPADLLTRGEWDTHALPVACELRAAVNALMKWPDAIGRRGVRVSTLWMRCAVLHAIDVLTAPGPGGLGGGVLARTPDKPGPTVRTAAAG